VLFGQYWKSLPIANTLAYYENPKFMAIKGFIGLGPGQQCMILKNLLLRVMKKT
jgi:hypothetical protein